VERMPRSIPAVLRVAALCLGAALVGAPLAGAATLLTTHGNVIAYTDGPAPGSTGGAFATIIEPPIITDDGTVFFRGQMYGGDVSGTANSRALFRGTTAADLAMMIRWSDPAPGLLGLSLINGAGTNGIQGSYRMSPDGRTLWSSFLSGPGVAAGNDTAIFGGVAGSPVLVSREGDPAPGTAGAVFSGDRSVSFQFSSINRNGSVLFQTNLSGGDVVGTTNNVALYTGPAGALGIVVRKGDTVLPGPVTASSLSGQTLMDNSGRVLYNLTLAGAGVSTSNNASLWVHTPGSGSTLLVREGQSAPGTAGATFNDAFDTWVPSLSSGGLNGSGKYAMTAVLQNGDVAGTANDLALYAGSTSGGLTLVARKGSPAPGTDAVFAAFTTSLTFINNAGAILTVASLSGGTADTTNNQALYIATPTGVPAAPYTLTLIVRAGDQAPGASGDIFGPVLSQIAAFNDLGQAVFNADLQGPDVIEGYNDRGVWAYDPSRGVFLVARGGDALEVDPGVFMTPVSFSYMGSGNTDGDALALSNAGTLAMNVLWDIGGSSVVTVGLGCYPPADYYPDADGDGYGDASAAPVSVCADAAPPAGSVTNNADCNDASGSVHPGTSDASCNGIDENCSGAADEGYVGSPTSCGVGACARTGATFCLNGHVRNSCTPGTPSAESCNGIDDNCDGTIDNAAPPSGRPGLTVQQPRTGVARLVWGSIAGATGYDAVRGSLVVLESSGGNFTTATTTCLGNDIPATTVDDNTALVAGQGLWFLLRAGNCGGSGSYDEGLPSQVGSRDAEIAASGNQCP